MYMMTVFQTGKGKSWEALAATSKTTALREALKKAEGHKGKTLIVGWENEAGMIEELSYRHIGLEDRWRHR